MAKTGSTFKLGKQFKTMVALTKGTNEQRNGWKRMFIDAEHSAEIAKLQSKRRSKDDRNTAKSE
jgi:RecA/RadA recombinase